MNIVMLVKDRPKLTEQALRSLADNTIDAYNITVVDDGSLPRTACLLNTWAKAADKSRTLIRVTDSGNVLADLKNLGVYWSEKRFGRSSGYLYLSDNDAYFTAGWDRALVEAYEDATRKSRILLLGGQNHPFHHPMKGMVLANGERWKVYESVAGTSWLMPWYAWDEFGPLRGLAAGVCQGEDHDFCQRIKAKGFEVGAIDPYVVYDTGITQTGGTPSPGADVKQRHSGVIYE